MERGEKRHFKLYVKRNTDSDELKSIQLFDALDRMNEYNEEQLLTRNPTIKKQQLSNIKANLYKQLLVSLRLLKSQDNIYIQLNEQLDYARILYNKGLYMQSLRTLDRIKENATTHNQVSLLVEILFLEKKIESLHITRSMLDKADTLTAEADAVNNRVLHITQLSNLALKLYSWYIKNGHARNQADELEVKQFFDKHLSFDPENVQGFYEQLYLYQSYSWYAFIRQDFLMYYRYTYKWVNLFEQQPEMITIETAQYIKGMHNLTSAHFDLKNYRKFDEDLQKFEDFAQTPIAQENDNNRIQTFVYLYLAKINKHFMEGTFTEGLTLIPEIEARLKEYYYYLDRHRVLVFYYKIASLYFGSGDNDKAIDYLNKIINWKVNLRTDLQCYARLLHLIAHYELGNVEILEYLVKSVYRFMAKMDNLSVVEEEIFAFIRASFKLSYRKLKPAFEELLNKLKSYENNRYETRAFSYLDITSWLESKIQNEQVENVIRKKFLAKQQKTNAR